MSMGTQIKSVPGEVSAKDGLNWILSGGKLWKAASLSAFVVFFLLLVIVFLEHKSLPKIAIVKLFHTSLIIFVVVTISSILCSVGIYFFLKPNQRYVSWTFTDEGFSLKDKAGNQITTPWTQVKVVKVNSKGVCIYCKPFGSRWVPTRFLPDETMREFRDLLKVVGIQS